MSVEFAHGRTARQRGRSGLLRGTDESLFCAATDKSKLVHCRVGTVPENNYPSNSHVLYGRLDVVVLEGDPKRGSELWPG